MTPPFVYPPTRHVRRHGPSGYSGYASYRPWVRDEFDFRCVYCLAREAWGRGGVLFALDHFSPVANHPGLERAYDNLVFTCSVCNAAKSDSAIPDPLVVLVGSAVSVSEDGSIHTDDLAAARLIERLGLDGPESTAFRGRMIAIVALAARYDLELHQRLMGYPDDLPDLGRLRPPGGNARPEGVARSAFARRKRGELPVIY